MSLQNIFEASLADSLNPMSGMMRNFAEVTIKEKQLSIDKMQSDNVQYFSDLLAKENDKDKPNQAAIDAYEKLIARYK